MPYFSVLTDPIDSNVCYLPATKYPSFERQLRNYGFRKLRRTQNCYIHPFFEKGNPGLLGKVLKGTRPEVSNILLPARFGFEG